MSGFVRSTDVPEALAERVAHTAHRRGCGAFDGGRANRAVPAPRFIDDHRRLDVLWTRIHIADLCNTLGIKPEQIAALEAKP